MTEKVGMYLGKEIIEDDSVKEIRIPKDFVEFLRKNNKFVEADEYGK